MEQVAADTAAMEAAAADTLTRAALRPRRSSTTALLLRSRLGRLRPLASPHRPGSRASAWDSRHLRRRHMAARITKDTARHRRDTEVGTREDSREDSSIGRRQDQARVRVRTGTIGGTETTTGATEEAAVVVAIVVAAVVDGVAAGVDTADKARAVVAVASEWAMQR